MALRLVLVVGRRERLAQSVHSILDPMIRALVRLIPSVTGALTFVEHLRPALVVADTHVQDSGGLRICERLKAQPGMRDVPVIAVDDGATLAEARQAGCDDVVPDPETDPGALARAIRRGLSGGG
jgi:CheY-like chemotaxis protein